MNTLRGNPDTTATDADAIYRSFFETSASPMGVVRLLAEDILVVANNAATASLFGMTIEELRGRSASELGIAAEDIRFLQARLRDCAASGAPVRFEFCPTHRTDNMHCLAIQAWPLPGQPQDASLFAFTADDITERCRAEEELRESEAVFRGVFETSAQAIGISVDGLLYRGNTAFAELFGFATGKAAAGLPLTAFVVPRDRQRIESLLRTEIDALSTPIFAGITGLSTDGTKIPLEGRISAFMHDGRRFTIALLSEAGAQRTVHEKLLRRNRDLERDNSQLKTLATVDALTELMNRRVLLDRLNQQFHRARADGEPLSLLMIDVDHFKQFNDTYGHVEGDEVLRQVARVLQETAREGDTVARYGGEEFALLLPATGLAGASTLTERIREAMAATTWPLRTITVSIGGAVLSGEMTNPTDLIIDADAALYEAKRAGRDRAVFR